MNRLKKLIKWAVLAGIIYVLFNYHFIIIGSGINVELLKKDSWNLDYIVFNARGKTNEKILAIDELREVGIGELLVEEGLMTEKEWDRILDKLDK